MTFTTTSLFLAGIAATIIPVVIHLLSKGKPKRVVFPALRFAQAKFVTNRRRSALKNLLLLCLRMGGLVLLGLLLARPYFAPKTAPKTIAEATQAQGEETQNDADAQEIATEPETVGVAGRDAPIATAIVIDSSVRMGRVRENQTLFDRARDGALYSTRRPKGAKSRSLTEPTTETPFSRTGSPQGPGSTSWKSSRPDERRRSLPSKRPRSSDARNSRTAKSSC